MNTRLLHCAAEHFGFVPLKPFNACHEMCMAIAMWCPSNILTKDIEHWCHNAEPGDTKVFGITLIVALPSRP